MNRVETTKSLAAASRGAVWLKALDPEAKLLGELIPSVAAADGEIDGRLFASWPYFRILRIVIHALGKVK